MSHVHRPNSLPGVDSADSPRFDPIDRGRLACWFAYALAFWGPVFAGIYGWALGSFAGSLAICVATTLVMLTPSVLERSGSAAVAGNYLTAVLFVLLTFLTSITGGHGSPPLLWNVAIPMFAAMLANLRSAVLWTVLVVGQFVVFFLIDRWGYTVTQHISAPGMRLLEVTGVTALAMLVLSLAVLFEHYRRLMKETLEASNKAKGEFLANMSHELRTPMTAILGFAESLGDADLSQSERDEAVGTIRRNGDHLLKIVNNILDISKIEANRIEIESSRFSVAELVWEVQDLMQVRVDKKSIAFEVEFTSPIPATIESDPTRLRQILINLVGNAIKFTDKGSVRVIVHFLPDRLRPLLRFDVIDTGIGIAEDQVDRLFHPFTQADGSAARKFSGTGLGLAISKRLTEMLGGTISVHSELGQGSQFGVTLPTRSTDEPLIKPVRGSESETPQLVTTDPAEKMLAGYRILVADDGVDSQRLILHILGKAGAVVTLVDNGRHAVEAATAADADGSPFDAILMDIRMASLDGLSATRQIRETGYRRPIIAVTAHSMEQDRIECLRAGCDEVVTKPVNRKTMIDTIVAVTLHRAERAML